MKRPTRGYGRGARRQSYRSGYEAKVALDLDGKRRTFAYEPMTVLYDVPRSYTVDFGVTVDSGKIIHIETKGYFPATDRRKMREVRDQHPELDIRLLFMNAKLKISKAKKALTYGGWATRNGFTWAQGLVPDAWLAE